MASPEGPMKAIPRGIRRGRLRVLSDEPPADPHGVGARVAQDARQQHMVEVGPGGRGPERVGLVGFAGEHGGAFGVGVERDGGDGGSVATFGVESRTAWMSRMAASRLG